MLTAVEKFKVVDDYRIAGLPGIGFEKVSAGGCKVSSQHKRIPAIVEQRGGFAGQTNGFGISLIGQVEARQTVVACGEPDPSRRVLWRFLDGIAKVPRSRAEIAAIEVFNGQSQGLIGRVVLNVRIPLYG